MLICKTRLHCDVCDSANSEREATATPKSIWADALAEGWKQLNGKHVCPDCWTIKKPKNAPTTEGDK